MVSLKLNTNPISETQLEKRRELEKKLQLEKAELEMLEKSLNLTADATVRMTAMLNSFDNRLARLESFIMPIHNSTQGAMLLTKDLETAISLISSYTNIVGTINFHEAIVAKGLSGNPLETYLDSIKKLKNALRQLETSKYKSSERITQDLVGAIVLICQRGRISKGMLELDDLFSKTLVACGEAETEENIREGRLSYGDKLKSLQTLSEVLSDTLEQIGPVTGFLKIYSDVRSTFLVNCVAHQNAAAKEQEGKMGYSREVYQRGSSLLIPYARTLVTILQAEHQASSDIIPKHHLPTTFVNEVTLCIDGFLEVCDALLNRVRRSLQRKETNDLYVLIDVWDGLSGVFLPYSNLMAQCGKKGHDIKTYLINAAATILGHFKDFYDEYKVGPPSHVSR
ncbi:exocyst complex component exo70 [Kappamyces sp. JEL0680]|nr:exocyst complex component exo70 [Kappamyces sp. JEL0680]